MYENLSRAPRLRSAEETWRIKEAVRDWLAAPAEQRQTQQDLARSLGVTKQYINLLVRRLPPSDIAAESQPALTERPAESVIPAHIAAREALLRSPVPDDSQPAETAQLRLAPVEHNREPSRIKLLADAHDAAIIAYNRV